MGAMEKITNWIAQRPEDDAFSTADLITLGSRSALDQALCRLVNAGKLRRLSRGIFIVQTSDTVDPVASALAVLSRRSGCPMQVSGDVALQRFGTRANNVSVASKTAQIDGHGAPYPNTQRKPSQDCSVRSSCGARSNGDLANRQTKNDTYNHDHYFR